MKSPHLPLTAPAVAVIALLLSACQGPDRKAMMEEVRHSIPPMAANEAYFDGQVVVHLTLAGNARDGAFPDSHEKGKASNMTGLENMAMGESNFGGGMGGGGSMDSGRGGESGRGSSHGSKSGTYQGNEGMGHVYEADESEPEYIRRRREAEMPPALLRLQLENTSPATVVVEIRDLNSDLGNFAVRPDTLTLNPGQTVETDPMQSKLGVDSYALPVSITLRSGGQTETKTLTLRLVNPAPNTAPHPPAR